MIFFSTEKPKTARDLYRPPTESESAPEIGSITLTVCVIMLCVLIIIDIPSMLASLRMGGRNLCPKYFPKQPKPIRANSVGPAGFVNPTYSMPSLKPADAPENVYAAPPSATTSTRTRTSTPVTRLDTPTPVEPEDVAPQTTITPQSNFALKNIFGTYSLLHFFRQGTPSPEPEPEILPPPPPPIPRPRYIP